MSDVVPMFVGTSSSIDHDYDHRVKHDARANTYTFWHLEALRIF